MVAPRRLQDLVGTHNMTQRVAKLLVTMAITLVVTTGCFRHLRVLSVRINHGCGLGK